MVKGNADIDTEDLKRELREDASSSESEPEDEYGELLTEDVEEGLNKVLNAIKNNDESLKDPKVRFFEEEKEKEEEEEEEKKTEEKKHKPIYLKEYHRMNLLGDGQELEDEEEEEEVDEDDIPDQPYTEQQRQDKAKLMSEINKEFGEDEDEEESFLKKKESDKTKKPITDEVVLPDPSVDGGKFLEAYMEKHAWIPDKGSKDLTVGMKEDDPEFELAAEKFENAYNFRFEDPNGTEIVSYARSQTTMRKQKVKGRKRERQRDQEEKRQEKEEVEKLVKRKKQKKMNIVMDRINEVRKAVGEDIPDSVIADVFGDSLIQEDFDGEEWDKKMTEVFEKYGNDQKPEWEEEEGEGEGEDDGGDEDSDEEVITKPATSKRAQKRELKHLKKQKKEGVKQIASEIVEKKAADLVEEVQEERGRSKDQEALKFRYREVSPESFGLTTRDILFAKDEDLNDFVGIKKLAPYRSERDKKNDKVKYSKGKRVKKWRKKVFRGEAEPPAEHTEASE
ncbi:DEKNAAC103108 [Brettanomyces naardenensis]|uniref:DEKNAAC103108 n=1 Tax=Brettanomyces naardenensis TaxID=13370 RepID=A0A448YMQ5_BRENA|nr:DEKNAAC103108 [Brettanomyces naardenensis]